MTFGVEPGLAAMEGGGEAPSSAAAAAAADMFSLAGLGAALRAVPESADAASLSYLQLPWQRERRVCKLPSHRRRRAARLHRKVGPMGKEIHGEGLGAARGQGLLRSRRWRRRGASPRALQIWARAGGGEGLRPARQLSAHRGVEGGERKAAAVLCAFTPE